ncbi:hypothetical protein PG984_010307 [Apiospora sp. TS-2023a]
MFSSLRSFLDWETEPSATPPLIAVAGVRIPADGTPPHLIPLTTISDPGAKTDFLFRVPDLRSHWKTKDGRSFRDLHRLNLQQDDNIHLSRYLRQKQDLQKVLMVGSSMTPDKQQLLHLRQRYLCPE